MTSLSRRQLMMYLKHSIKRDELDTQHKPDVFIKKTIDDVLEAFICYNEANHHQTPDLVCIVGSVKIPVLVLIAWMMLIMT